MEEEDTEFIDWRSLYRQRSGPLNLSRAQIQSFDLPIMHMSWRVGVIPYNDSVLISNDIVAYKVNTDGSIVPFIELKRGESLLGTYGNLIWLRSGSNSVYLYDPITQNRDFITDMYLKYVQGDKAVQIKIGGTVVLHRYLKQGRKFVPVASHYIGTDFYNLKAVLTDTAYFLSYKSIIMYDNDGEKRWEIPRAQAYSARDNYLVYASESDKNSTHLLNLITGDDSVVPDMDEASISSITGTMDISVPVVNKSGVLAGLAPRRDRDNSPFGGDVLNIVDPNRELKISLSKLEVEPHEKENYLSRLSGLSLPVVTDTTLNSYTIFQYNKEGSALFIFGEEYFHIVTNG